MTRPGIYRHHKGQLFQALAFILLSDLYPAGGPTTLFPARDASEGADRRRLEVGVRGELFVAWPVGAAVTSGPEITVRAAVLYIGLTLDGALPGPRLRVRDLVEFHEPVRWPDGSTRPRFEFLGEEWMP